MKYKEVSNLQLESLSEAEAEKKGDQKPHKPERELFVKYADYSYWDCEWISELQVGFSKTFTYLQNVHSAAVQRETLIATFEFFDSHTSSRSRM